MKIYNNVDVTVIGGTFEQRKLAGVVSYFSIEKLMPEKNELDIYISIENLEGKFDDWNGFMVQAKDKKSYDIALDEKITDEQLTKTLIHELIHVWQYEIGFLKDCYKQEPARTFWKNKDYTNVPYSRMPWERQAKRMQPKLIAEFGEWQNGQNF